VRQLDMDPLPHGGAQPFVLSFIPAAPAVRVDAVAWGMKEAE
jgi:hypothetical protein